MQLLPAIDILEGKVVRLAKGDYNAVTVYNDSPIDQAKAFEEMGAEWIHVVDLDGARSGNPSNLPLIEDILAKTMLKVEMGGGIRTMDTLQRIWDAGVNRVVLGTSLISNLDFTREAIAKFPTMLTAGVDARNGEVSVDGWMGGSGVAAETLIAQMRDLGFQHLVYTDISKDGMQTGLDVDTRASCASLRPPGDRIGRCSEHRRYRTACTRCRQYRRRDRWTCGLRGHARCSTCPRTLPQCHHKSPDERHDPLQQELRG